MLTFNFKDDQLEQEAIEATAAFYNYQENVMNQEEGKPMPNPMSKRDFVIQVFAGIMKASVIKQRKVKATQEAAAQVELEGKELELL